MSEKYLIGNWIALVQQIQHLVSRGYVEYCMVKYPEHKEHKFLQIDQKLIDKYNANLNKDKTYYNKKKKYSNFKFLRFEDTAIILKTKGNLHENIIFDDVFLNVKKEKICVVGGDRAKLLIGYDDEMKATVFLDRETYKEVKATCFEYIDRKQYYKAVETFNNLNALPSWGGIVEQKIRMKGQIVKKMKKNLPSEKVYGLSTKMIINTKRHPVKVF